MKIMCLVFAVLLVIGCKNAASDYFVPPNFYEKHRFHPGSYVEDYVVADVKETLSKKGKAKLINLIGEAHNACVKKYFQDCSISTSSNIYKLIQYNFPDVETVEAGLGSVVFLGDVYRLLGKVE